MLELWIKLIILYSSDINKHLEENYCRSPGSGTEPWCYYEASQCMVDTCDVSLIGNKSSTFSY